MPPSREREPLHSLNLVGALAFTSIRGSDAFRLHHEHTDSGIGVSVCVCVFCVTCFFLSLALEHIEVKTIEATLMFAVVADSLFAVHAVEIDREGA